MERFSKVYKEKFRFTRIQKILITVCVICLGFGVFTRFIGGNVASKYGYDVFSMLRYSLIDHPVQTVTGFSEDLSSLWQVKDENDELRSELASQNMYKAELDETKRKLQELEELNELTSNSDYESISANILNRDTQGWSNTITLDKGTNDGITEDMAVICSKGLIGKVVEANPNSSKVKLLTESSADTKISIRVEIDKDTTAGGTLEGYDPDTGMYTVNVYDSNVKIEEGMKIITSGTGQVFPSGILIGKVSEVSDKYDEVGKSVLVKPAVNFDSFNYVSVLKVK